MFLNKLIIYNINTIYNEYNKLFLLILKVTNECTVYRFVTLPAEGSQGTQDKCQIECCARKREI